MLIYNGSQLNKQDFILRYTIKDKILLERVFNLDQEKKDILFNGRTIMEAINFIYFLKGNYSDRAIVQLFENINTNKIRSMVVHRTFQIYKSLSSLYVYCKFKRVHYSFAEIYNELTRLKSKEKYWEKPSMDNNTCITRGINNIIDCPKYS